MWVPDLLLLDSDLEFVFVCCPGVVPFADVVAPDPEFVFIWCAGVIPSTMLGLFKSYKICCLPVAAPAAMFSLFFSLMMCSGSFVFWL